MGNGTVQFDPSASYAPAPASFDPNASYEPAAQESTPPSQPGSVAQFLGKVGDAGRTFVSAVGDKINPVSGAQSLVQMAEHPVNTYEADAAARAQIYRQAQEDFKAGNYGVAATRLFKSAIPLLGPQMNEASNEIDSGQVAKGLGHSVGMGLAVSTPAILKGAGSVAGSAVDAVSDAIPSRSSLASKIVAPLVRKPVGATLEDARFGRDPAAAISDEGLVGTKPQIVKQANQRISDLSDATDAQLQNHPNANVQIDAEPIIDTAIAKATRAAKRVGNQAAVTRLSNLSDALKTEYGPLQGTPFEINNLKRAVGDAGSDLGAFKSTDPLEASAASAMADVYTGLKNAVNTQVPEVVPLNARVADLLSARTGLNRNIALEENKSMFSGVSLTNLPFKAAEKTLGSAPMRTAAARVLNVGNTLDVPEVQPVQASAQPTAPTQRLLPRGPLVTPPTTSESSATLQNAQRTSQQGPGGQFQRVYTSGVGPAQRGTVMGQIAKVGDERWLWNGDKWYPTR